MRPEQYGFPVFEFASIQSSDFAREQRSPYVAEVSQQANGQKASIGERLLFLRPLASRRRKLVVPPGAVPPNRYHPISNRGFRLLVVPNTAPQFIVRGSEMFSSTLRNSSTETRRCGGGAQCWRPTTFDDESFAKRILFGCCGRFSGRQRVSSPAKLR